MQIPSGLATTGGSPKESEVASVYHRLFSPDHCLSYFWQRTRGEYIPEENLFPFRAVDDPGSNPPCNPPEPIALQYLDGWDTRPGRLEAREMTAHYFRTALRAPVCPAHARPTGEPASPPSRPPPSYVRHPEIERRLRHVNSWPGFHAGRSCP